MTITAADLSANELAAIKICLNYGDRASQLSDNFSNGGQQEFMSALKINRHQAAQLIGSLEAKGLGWSDNEQEDHGNIFWLSPLAVNLLFDVIEARETSPR
jgi:hypothetical protein